MFRADRLEAEQIEALRRAWHEGIDSGDAGVLDFAELRVTRPPIPARAGWVEQ